MEIVNTTASLFGNFVGGAILGLIVGWFVSLWYFRGGKAKAEAELARFEARAKAQGVILRE
jgi:hypothetical protein